MYRKQEGWTMVGLLLVIAVVMFFAYIVMKLVPVYLDNEEVKHAMEVGLTKGDPKLQTRNTIIRNMYSQMVIDDTDLLTDWKNAVSYKKTRDKVVFTNRYDRVVPLYDNISLLISFNNVMEISTR